MNNNKNFHKKWIEWFKVFTPAEGNCFSCRRLFSHTVNKNNIKIEIDPYFVTGFCDAESTFVLSIQENNRLKTGWVIRPVFSIVLHYRDLDLLVKLKSFFFLER